MNNKEKYTIRRHLGEGVNKGHFQVRGCASYGTQGKDVLEYINPDTHSIIMNKCRLHLGEAAVNRVIREDRKRPCAWVVCESYVVVPLEFATGEEVKYNPMVNKHWTNESNEEISQAKFDKLVTSGAQVFKA